MSEKGKVYIYIQSYDCVEYIEKVIDDVKKQTYQNWKCLIYDNASSDGTWDIVRSYTANDARFIVARFEKQVGLMVKQAIPMILKLANIEKDYFVRIDADDRIDDDYLQRMIEFREEHGVDLVCCGNNFVAAKNGAITGRRSCEEDMILEGEMFSDMLLQYQPFMRTHWAKLFPVSLLCKMRLNSVLDTAYGIDTLFSEEAFREAAKIGIMKDCMYHYYMHEGQKTYDLRIKRYEAPEILTDKLMDYLILKTGKITKENIDIIYRVFDGEMQEAVKALQGTDFPDEQKLKILYSLAKSHHTGNFLKRGSKAKWIYDIVLACVDMYKNATEEEKEKIAEIMSIMQVCPSDIRGVSKQMLFGLYVKMDKYWTCEEGQKPIEEYVEALFKESPLVTFSDMRLAILYAELMVAILGEDYAGAYEMVKNMLSDSSESVIHARELAEVGKNLSAVLGDEDSFIQMTKFVIRELLLNKKYQEAIVELEDWDLLLPNDEEFRAFRCAINAQGAMHEE